MELSKLSPAAFAIALLCFFMPFLELSCQGQHLGSYTGIQLVTGTTVKEPQILGPPKERKIPPDLLAILAIASGGVGLVLAFGATAGRLRGAAVFGAVGALLLLILKSRADNAIAREGEGLLHLEYGIGFWGAVTFYVTAALLGFIMQPSGGTKGARSERTSTRPKALADRSPSTASDNPPATIKRAYCSQCGAQGLPDARFCQKCGAAIE